jgi:hypothetical protein
MTTILLYAQSKKFGASGRGEKFLTTFKIDCEVGV